MAQGQEVFDNGDGTMSTGGLPHTVPTDSATTTDGDVAKGLSMPKGVKKAVTGMLETAKAKLGKLIESIKGAAEDEEMKGLPGPTQSECKAIASTLRGVSSRYPSPKSKSDDDLDEQAVAGEDDIDLEKAIAIAGPVKAKIVQSLEQAMSRLDSLLSEVASADETEEQSPTPLPDQVARSIGDIAAMLDGLTSAYPSPKSGKKGDMEGDEEDEEKKKTNKAVSSSKALSEAASVLDAVVAKVSPGQSLDEDSYQKLDRLRALLASALKTKGSDSEGVDEEEKDNGVSKAVAKAGAKMSTDRRRKFEMAIKSLIELFKEVIPKSELGKMPHLVTKSDEPTEADELRSKLSKAEEDLASARTEINELKSRPAPSNISTVEGIAKASPKKANDVEWPMDMNAED